MFRLVSTVVYSQNMEEPSISACFAADGSRPVEAAAKSPAPQAVAFLAIFILFWGVYIGTGCYQRNPFNAHVYLAYSLLHGRFDLINPPAYLETVKFSGRSYVAYGIAPSLLMLPFVAIWGLDFHQPVFMAGLAALAVSLWSSTLGRLGIHGLFRGLLTTLFGLGSLLWFYGGAKGNTWSLMHVTAVFGLTLSIHEIFGKRRGWLVGIAFGIAVLSREPVLLSLPFFVGMLWIDDSKRINGALTREMWFASCLGALIIFDAFYNAARFGSVFDNGYQRVILATTAPRFLPWGIFSFRYVPQNAHTYFLKLPENLAEFPWYDPTMGGFSVLISTPALFLAAAADYRKRSNLLALGACLGIQVIYLTYFWSGYEQFGCRYTIDYLPFVNLLAASGSKNQRVRPLLSATLAGLLVEMWGIGWWRYKSW
jgi:hypothetical protein